MHRPRRRGIIPHAFRPFEGIARVNDVGNVGHQRHLFTNPPPLRLGDACGYSGVMVCCSDCADGGSCVFTCASIRCAILSRFAFSDA